MIIRITDTTIVIIIMSITNTITAIGFSEERN